jgi:hypothetical protein
MIDAGTSITAAGNDASATFFFRIGTRFSMSGKSDGPRGAVEVRHLPGGQDIGSLEVFSAAINKVTCVCRREMEWGQNTFKDYLAWPYTNECQQRLSDATCLIRRAAA